MQLEYKLVTILRSFLPCGIIFKPHYAWLIHHLGINKL